MDAKTEVMVLGDKNVTADQVIAGVAGRLECASAQTKEGYAIVRAGIAELTKLRTGVESSRKALKKSALEYGKAVDEEARRVTRLIRSVEEPLRAMKKEVDDEKSRIKREKEEAKRIEQQEAERVEREKAEAERKAKREAAEAERKAEKEALDKEREELAAERARIAEEREVINAEKKRLKDEQDAKEAEARRIEEEKLEAERIREAEEEAEALRLQSEANVKEEFDREMRDRQSLTTFSGLFLGSLDDYFREFDPESEWGKRTFELTTQLKHQLLPVPVQEVQS